ncbi:hypothetical protein LguiB_022115 [Lonicera macranthoides]
MFGSVVKEEKIVGETMKDDEELEMLLGEIPHATSLNLHDHHHHHHVHGGHGHGHGYFPTHNKVNDMMFGMYDDDSLIHYNKHNTCPSPVSGFSLHSDGSSSSLFSNGHSLSDNGSPTPPQMEDLKSHVLGGNGNSHYPNGLLLDSKLPSLSVRNKANESMIDELNLSRNLRRMYISEEKEDVSLDSNGFRFGDLYTNRNNVERFGASDNFRKVFPDYNVVQSSVPRSPMNFSGETSSDLLAFQQEHRLSNLLGSLYRTDNLPSQPNCAVNSQCNGTKDQGLAYFYHRSAPLSNLASPISRPSINDTLFYAPQNGLNLIEERGSFNSPNIPQVTQPRYQLNMENLMHQYPPILNGRTRVSSNIRGGFEAFNREDSLIIEGEGLNYAVNKGFGRSRGHNNKGSLMDIGVVKPIEKRSQLYGRNERVHSPFSLPLKFNTLAEAQGYIYLIAKDQNGCRFLQRMFDEGTPLDVLIIFNEIIDHVVELMVNPFGNYLMQKLLEVCTEEQKLRILLVVTEEPGELVRISLNNHGTRVVQKLIETLRTRQQISLVVSSLEPGFLALIKDPNGNHVVQRCLQCLSSEDNKFIFVAAAKYCLDIATHQHGCCVLIRCISHSTGKHRENLVAEISENGLLLAQDAFGNYVVQFILELKIAYATSKLISQFEGNYVHLSTQKFSSHVVEKCLSVSDDVIRSNIIHELLSANHFEQLLQDPHANYVVQTALRFSEGPLHNSLVDAIESHKAISRNSPYSKRIFSHKLLKK